MTVTDTLTLVGITLTCFVGLASAIIGVINLFITYNFSKKLKAFEINSLEIRELNAKMHDRLTEVENAIKLGKNQSDRTKQRLLLNANRLTKYDDTIVADVNRLIEKTQSFETLVEKSKSDPDEISRAKDTIDRLITSIRTKVDNLQP